MPTVIAKQALGQGLVIFNGDLRNSVLSVSELDRTNATQPLGNSLYFSISYFDDGNIAITRTFHSSNQFDFSFTNLREINWRDDAYDLMVTLSGLDVNLYNGQFITPITSFFNGKDRFEGNGYGDLIYAGDGYDKLFGNAGDDSLYGERGNDSLYGGSGKDSLSGSTGADLLDGGAGLDFLNGGLGADTLDGGADARRDDFIYNSTADSKPGTARDVILHFTSGMDRIDLSALDANTQTILKQDFTFANRATANAVWFWDSGDNIIVKADVNGDAIADLEIRVLDTTTMISGDFIL